MGVYLLTKNGTPLAQTQDELTPLQREVLLAGIRKEAEEKEKAANQNGGGGGHSSGNGVPSRNSMSGKKTLESKHYVNTGPDGVDDFEQEQ